MNTTILSIEETAEIMRKKHRYREMVLSGRLVIPHARAAQLIGPDCLYHLYSIEKITKKRRAKNAGCGSPKRNHKRNRK